MSVSKKKSNCHLGLLIVLGISLSGLCYAGRSKEGKGPKKERGPAHSRQSDNLPPGIAKNKSRTLPYGLQKKAARGEELPPPFRNRKTDAPEIKQEEKVANTNRETSSLLEQKKAEPAPPAVTKPQPSEIKKSETKVKKDVSKNAFKIIP